MNTPEKLNSEEKEDNREQLVDCEETKLTGKLGKKTPSRVPQQTGKVDNGFQTTDEGRKRHKHIPPLLVFDKKILEYLFVFLGFFYLIVGYLIWTGFGDYFNLSIILPIPFWTYLEIPSNIIIIPFLIVLGFFYLFCIYCLEEGGPRGRPILLGLLGFEIFTRVAELYFLSKSNILLEEATGNIVLLAIESLALGFLIHYFLLLRRTERGNLLKKLKKPQKRKQGRILHKKYLVMGIFFLVVSQMALVASLLKANYETETYNKLYRGNSYDYDLLTFEDPLPFEPYRYLDTCGFIQNTTYYALGYYNYTSRDLLLLEVQFAPDFSKIVDYTVYETPLNFNNTIFTGLTRNETCFFTLGFNYPKTYPYDPNFIWKNDLIGFTPDGILFNRSLPTPSYGEDPKTPTDAYNPRGNIVLVDSMLYVVQTPSSLPDNVTVYDLSTLQEQFSLEVLGGEIDALGKDEEETLWVYSRDGPFGKNGKFWSGLNKADCPAYIGYDLNCPNPTTFTSAAVICSVGEYRRPDFDYNWGDWALVTNRRVITPIGNRTNQPPVDRIRSYDLVGFSVISIKEVETHPGVYVESVAGIFLFALCVVSTFFRFDRENPVGKNSIPNDSLAKKVPEYL